MFRQFTSQLAKTQVLLKHNFSRRLYNSTNSVYQQSQEYDIRDEIIDILNDKTDKSKAEKAIAGDLNRTINKLQRKFQHCFDLEETSARKLVTLHRNLLALPMPKLSRTIEFLFGRKVTVKTILENMWLLEMTISKFVYFWRFYISNPFNSC